jgi:hypothetical protein
VSDDGAVLVMQTSATNLLSAEAATAPPVCGVVTATSDYNNFSGEAGVYCPPGSTSQNPTVSGDGSTTGADGDAPQPGTDSGNGNVYTQDLGKQNSVSSLSGDYSGQWFDRTQSGHGIVVDVQTIGNDQHFVSMLWFVFVDQQPTWLLGTGIAQAGSGADAGKVVVVMNGVTIQHSTAFPIGATPTAATWGSIELVFDDSNSGSMRWTSSYPGFNSGMMPLQRLTALATPQDDQPTDAVKACYAGNWFNAAESGHGFEFEVTPATASIPRLLTIDWFTYAPNGAPTWLSGAAPVQGNSATVQLLQLGGPGANFPPAFDASAIAKPVWGTATVTFTDAGHAQVGWTTTTQGYSNGSLALQPLFPGGLDRRSCQ